jgi:3-isopropylmalate/(R)-2-methylmalate dehydratase small subunit
VLIEGRVWKFGNDVNTDVIYPGKYLATFEPEEMAKHCFESVYPEFVRNVKPGDIIVAGKYFGCGSSREQAATCLKSVGIGCIVADSFARIYYRNAINQGLPLVILRDLHHAVEEGDHLEIDLERGTLRVRSTGTLFEFDPLPDHILRILKDGGLIAHTKKTLSQKR